MGDWRIDNLKWTRGAVLHFRKYIRFSENWDHDHCEGRWAKFMESGSPEILTEGYVTDDNYRWICPLCFQDLKEQMGWTLDQAVQRTARVQTHLSGLRVNRPSAVTVGFDYFSNAVAG